MFLTPTSTSSSSSGSGGSVSLGVTLNDAAAPGEPYVAIGAYGGNASGSPTPTNSGFGTLLFDFNTTGDGGYYALTGYTLAASGSTNLQVTQNSSRHVFAGIAVSAVAIPEPSLLILSGLGLAVGISCVRHRKN